MLEADIPLSLMDLIIIFFVRTIVAIPLVAVATHIIF
jgi:nucleoside recognition membrane protein YjiH